MTNKSFISSFLMLAITAVLVFIIDSRGLPVVAATNLENLPMTIAGFQATESSFPQAVYDELNADLHVYRQYTLNDGVRSLDLYIGYYGTAKGGRTPHNPYACFPSAGWAILDEQNVVLQPDQYPQEVEVKSLHVRNGEMDNIVFHWYQSAGDKVLKDGLRRNMQRFVGKIFHNRNDGAFVRISCVADKNNIEETKKLVSSFAREILTLLPQYWPQEKDQPTAYSLQPIAYSSLQQQP